jgi:hypothetical protein
MSKASGQSAKSSMPDQTYDFERGDLVLLKPVPHPLDSALASFCRQFVKSGHEERAAMRAAISTNKLDTLLTFAHRAAVFAIREHSAPWAIDGLTAITMIEAERIDWRQILIALGLVHHGATRAGLDADQLFHDLSTLAEPGTGELIQGFAKRAPSNKRLEAWRYEDVETDAGIGLIQLGTDGRGFGSTKPTYDLIAIATEMADCFASDKYRLCVINFGEMMPRIWLESNDDTVLNEALKAFRTGASISAELQPTTGWNRSANTCGVPAGDEDTSGCSAAPECRTEEQAHLVLQG